MKEQVGVRGCLAQRCLQVSNLEPFIDWEVKQPNHLLYYPAPPKYILFYSLVFIDRETDRETDRYTPVCGISSLTQVDQCVQVAHRILVLQHKGAADINTAQDHTLHFMQRRRILNDPLSRI